jgi:hypothetical protein
VLILMAGALLGAQAEASEPAPSQPGGGAERVGAEAPRHEEEREAEKREEEERPAKEEAERAAKEREVREAGERAGREAAERERAEVQCVVPRLRGDSLNGARRALGKAHCRLGKASAPRKHHGALVVTAQSVRAGRKLAKGAAVAVKLGSPRH